MTIETVASTASTNADLLARAKEGAPEGLWLRAERQKGGRGRLGREWISPKGNLYASTIIRPVPGDPAPASLAFVAGLAVHDILAPLMEEGLPLLKWPNDIMGAHGKLGGILLESQNDAVVAGIGINIASAPDIADRQTSSLKDEGVKRPPAASTLVKRLAGTFEQRLAEWRRAGIAFILAEWRARAHGVGTPLAVRTGRGEVVEGEFAGLARDGALRLRNEAGSTITIRAGDVEILGDGSGHAAGD